MFTRHRPEETPLYRVIYHHRDELERSWEERPSSASKGHSRAQYLTLPDSIIVRELLYRITKDGFRSTAIRVLTTLTDVEKYSAEQIAELYGLRWEIETNFNHLKTTLKMDILTTKTVDGIKRELLAFAILYKNSEKNYPSALRLKAMPFFS